MRCHRYRPRQPHASPVWQVFHDHAHRLTGLAPATTRGLNAFLRCGDLHAGFTRLHCAACGHDFLLAFSCKQRGLCATCHQRRTLTEAATIAEQICAPVPHRHLVLTLPRLLRGLFQRTPSLLGELYHATRDVLTRWLRARTDCPTGQPGLVVAVQTFGDYLLWHPHVHVLAAAGVFTNDGHFHLASTGGWDALRELWHTLLRRLRDAHALAPETLARLLQWRHSGFGVDGGEAPLAAEDVNGCRRLAEYLLRAPYALEKITYQPATGTVLYRSERHWRTRRNSEVFSALGFIHALLAQLPAKGCPQVRYYGRYSNKHRGHLAARTSAPSLPAGASTADRAPAAAGVPPARTATAPRRRPAWRDLIRQVWGDDPLRCPRCSGPLRPSAVVKTAAAILATLTTLGLDERTLPPANGPPPPGHEVLVDAASGTRHPIAPSPCPTRLPYPQTRPEKLRFRAEMAPAGQAYDQLGFEWGPEWAAIDRDAAQGELFGDESCQPDAPDGEPIFWLEPAADGVGFYPDEAPADEGVQADALQG